MELDQNPLIDGLSKAHLVRQWWEGRLEGDGVLGGWPSRPDRAPLDALREPTGEDRVDRDLLVEVVSEQYARASMAIPEALGRLAINEARTVTTGHQLCLAGGPAFTLYKALTAVHMAQWLEGRWGTPVVPVFWLASEDHDFEEVQALWDGAEWHRWEGEGESSRGAVGRMEADGAQDLLGRWADAAGLAAERKDRILGCASGSLSDAMRRWIHDLVGANRILVLDGDDPRLKGAFAERMVREIQEDVLFREVGRVNAVLDQNGHDPKVHVRKTNLFHLTADGRHRLVSNGDGWTAGAHAWPDSQALIEEVKADPAAFSPNALFRPLYQAYLLPDVAVVGGLAEVAYWLQLTTAYAAFGLVRPVLVPRDGARVVPGSWTALASSLGVTRSEFGADLNAWEAHWLAAMEGPSTDSWRTALDREADAARAHFTALDASLEGSVEAARAKVHKVLDKLEGQGRRALRRQHAEELAQLARLHGWLHPEGNPQERVASVHALADAWQEDVSLEDTLNRSFLEGHRGEDWRPVLHELLGGAP